MTVLKEKPKDDKLKDQGIMEDATKKLISLWKSLDKGHRNAAIKFNVKRRRDSSILMDIIEGISKKKHWPFESLISSPNLLRFISEELESCPEKYIKEIAGFSLQYLGKQAPFLLTEFFSLTKIEIPNGNLSQIKMEHSIDKIKLQAITEELVQKYPRDEIKLLYLVFNTFNIKNLDGLADISLNQIDKIEIKEKVTEEITSDAGKTEDKYETIDKNIEALEQKIREGLDQLKQLSDDLNGSIIPPDTKMVDLKALRIVYDKILSQLQELKGITIDQIPQVEIHNYDVNFIKKQLSELKNKKINALKNIEEIFYSVIGLCSENIETQSKLELMKIEFLKKYYDNLVQSQFDALNELLGGNNIYKSLIEFVKNIHLGDISSNENLYKIVASSFDSSIVFKILSKCIEIRIPTKIEFNQYVDSVFAKRLIAQIPEIKKEEVIKPCIKEEEKKKEIAIENKVTGQNLPKPIAEITIPLKPIIANPIDLFGSQKHLYENVFNFINHDMFSAAYIINYHINLEKNSKQIPNWLLESIILSKQLQEANGELSGRLKELFEEYNYNELMDNDNPAWNDCINLLLFSASIIPALRAPVTGSAVILMDLKFNDHFKSLFGLIREFGEFSTLGYALDKKYIRMFHDSYDVEKHKTELVNEVNQWYQRTKNKKINYTPAKRVLHFLTDKEGLVFQLVEPIINNNSKTNNLEKLIAKISNEEFLEKEIIITNRKVNSKYDKIEGLAFDTILAKMNNALSYAQQWVELNNHKMDSGYDFIFKKANELRSSFNKLYDSTICELEEFNNNQDIFRKTSAQLAKNSLISLEHFFNPQIDELYEEKSVTDLLEEDLVILSSKLFYKILDKIYSSNESKINFEKFLDLIINDKDISDEIISEILNHNVDQKYYSLFQRHCEDGNHILTEGLVNKIITNKEIDRAIEDPEQNRLNSLKYNKGLLQNKIELAQSSIEIGLTEDLITESQRSEFLSSVTSINVDSDLNFGYNLYRLRKIEEEINNLKIEKKNKLFERIKLSSIKDKEQLKALLDNDKLATAQAYLESIERGETFFEFPLDKTRLENFLQANRKINDFLSDFDRSPVDLMDKINKLDKNSKFGTIQLPTVKLHLFALQEVLQSWFKIKFDRQVLENTDLSIILKWLGFDTKEENISLSSTENQTLANFKWFNIATSNTAQSPIPKYGSLANKNYKILCVWQGESISKVIDVITSQKTDSALIVFNFWRIDEKGRRILCKSCYENKLSVLVMDDILLFYLAGLKESQITNAFFETTLPFSYSLPYITAAGSVPKEMFYGRQNEISDIINPKGTCIIYGGRQLGKTAILRKIQNEYNSPEKGLYVLFIDLKAKGFGIYNQNPEYIWQLIGNELKNCDIVKRSQWKSFDEFDKEIKGWLNKFPENRILVLLDEADKFIEIDAKENLLRLSQLRGLMDDTNSRFKFVLSGLHNVQRFTKISNSTISHLLTRGCYCIGPLIKDGEQFEAVKLITNPFRALGYQFDNEEIVYKILNHTNYYPSLIQLFCDNLLREMYEQISHRFDFEQNPPFIITKEHIDDVYSKKQKLRKDIIDRFQWTLNLDPRYELIAYIIALLSYENNNLYRDGLTIQNVSEEVIRWKKEIFRSDNQYEDIKDILEEMIGLGILRKTIDNKFSLKDSNIFRLLGNKNDIEVKLLSIDDKPLSIDLEIDSYRRNDPLKVYELSPLTAKQENLLLSSENSVVLIGGLEALGMQNCIHFLDLALKDSVVETDFEQIQAHVNSHQTFQGVFEDFLNNKKCYLSLLVVPSEINWDESWMTYTLERLKNRRSTNYIKKVLFFADGSIMWSFLSQSKSTYQDFLKNGLQEIRLRKISNAMIDNWASVNMIEKKEEILQSIGNWLGLHYKYLIKTDGNKIKLNNPFDSVPKSIAPTKIQELIALFGLQNDSIRGLLIKMNDYHDPISIDELYEWCENIFPLNVLEDIIDWCVYFSIINQNNERKYRLDPIVSKILGKFNER